MKCCICGRDLADQPAMVDHALGEAFCQQDGHYFGVHPSNRPRRANVREPVAETKKGHVLAGETESLLHGTTIARQTIAGEADSLEEARKQIEAQKPQGLAVLAEKIVSDGKPRTARAAADTADAAFAEAQRDVPADAVVLERKEVTPAARKTVSVEAFDEKSARAQIKGQLKSYKEELV